MINNPTIYQLATIIKRFAQSDQCYNCPIIDQHLQCNSQTDCKLTICKYLSALTDSDIPNTVDISAIEVCDNDYKWYLHKANSIHTYLQQTAHDVMISKYVAVPINNEILNNIKQDIMYEIQGNDALINELHRIKAIYCSLQLTDYLQYKQYSVSKIYEVQLEIMTDGMVNITFPTLFKIATEMERYDKTIDSKIQQNIVEELTAYTKQ